MIGLTASVDMSCFGGVLYIENFAKVALENSQIINQIYSVLGATAKITGSLTGALRLQTNHQLEFADSRTA